LVFGGIPSLAVVIDDRAARRAPAPFAIFFSGLGYYAFFIVGGLVDAYVSHAAGGLIIMLVAPVAGGIGGALLGYRLGLRRRRRMSDDNF
jgi:hypothetical protein